MAHGCSTEEPSLRRRRPFWRASVDLHERPESTAQPLEPFEWLRGRRTHEVAEFGEHCRRLGVELERGRQFHSRAVRRDALRPQETSDYEIVRSTLPMETRFQHTHRSYDCKGNARRTWRERGSFDLTVNKILTVVRLTG